MNSDARIRIYNRLRTALVDAPAAEAPLPEVPPSLNQEEKVTGFTALMEAVRTEVYRVSRDSWLSKLTDIIRAKKIGTLLYGPGTWLAVDLEAFVDQKDSSGVVRLRSYDEEVEAFKKELFDIDAGITTSLGGIADRGALILWPTPQEPRLISLAPSIHIAVVEAEKIYGSLTEAMQDQGWSKGMPTNALLVSGPSKTADIEFTLVFGVHGPKELIVIVIT